MGKDHTGVTEASVNVFLEKHRHEGIFVIQFRNLRNFHEIGVAFESLGCAILKNRVKRTMTVTAPSD